MELEFGDAHFNVIEILKVLGNYTDTQAFLRVNSKVFWFFFFFASTFKFIDLESLREKFLINLRLYKNHVFPSSFN